MLNRQHKTTEKLRNSVVIKQYYCKKTRLIKQENYRVRYPLSIRKLDETSYKEEQENWKEK